MLSIGFGTQVCGDLAAGATREWLVPDGLGGYAMGTVSGLRTRRYHGLLVVPGVRHLALAALDPVLTWPSGARVRLGTHEWASGAVEPAGHTYLESFDLVDGLPCWRWRIGDVLLERTLAMETGRTSLAVRHRLLAGGPVRLVLDALCTWRDAHGERTAAGPPPVVAPAADGAVVEGAYRLAGPSWAATGDWWRGVHHREERARGLSAEEDLWHAGTFTADLAGPGTVLDVAAWAGDLGEPPPPVGTVIDAARRRLRAIAAGAPGDAVAATLRVAASAFIVATPTGPDVVAGYPWFGPWTRDTLTSYEGLFLATGWADEGRELLRAHAATLSEGMLANTADTGAVEYNSVDAALWFPHAVGRHVRATGDLDLAAELGPTLRAIVEHHLAGTRYGIGVDPADGLLRQGAPGVALTWMDARVDGVPVTPRTGKPVEVNALWINALAAVGDLARRVGESPGPADAAHDRALSSFAGRYPGPDGLLYDVVDGPAGDDPTIRPNQLLAWSLPGAPLRPTPEQLARLAARLLTPLGLRSLGPSALDYRPAHRGGPAERDAAYHQGTVWPWLLGPYADACARAGVPGNDLFGGVEKHLSEFGLGSVSETTDGDPPHAATGCPFQAWSVAEVLRSRPWGSADTRQP
ncbi:glycogen debranching protein [Longispora fulva]|uniref:Putative glycogen debranching enzyme n=1 Tax=Longispora fulva TaxID=619741 RepID=A0A8J7GSV6_9ACTN|nr:amylo-alpha-1,6-glucosidase [Longispora fulva]MBG6137683.1 putative glycogen debranching enzyme [Longispora fulva]GIG62158.1 glycogen debranching protein [Longispora fulva]